MVQTQINFLDVTVSLENGKIETDLMLSLQIFIYIFILLHVTPIIGKTEFKRNSNGSQTLRLNRICSDSISFDKKCNDLERWLLETGYKEKKVWKQVLRGRATCRDNILNRQRTLEE